MKELKTYVDNLKTKYGPVKNYPLKTPFDPNVHFDLSAMFGPDVAVSASKIGEVPKIPPLTKPHLSRSTRPSLSETISKAMEMKKSPHSSDGDDHHNSPAPSPSGN